MQRISKITIDQAQGKAKDLLTGAKNAMGAELNIFSTMANAPAALEGLLGLVGALGKGKLPAKLREQIALVTAGYNGCDYCASAHTYLAGKAGVPAEEATANLAGDSSDGKTQAALTFARKLVEHRGHVSDADFAALRSAGFNDEELVEILAHVALNSFTNYFNVAFKVEVDMPLVSTAKTSKAA